MMQPVVAASRDTCFMRAHLAYRRRRRLCWRQQTLFTFYLLRCISTVIASSMDTLYDASCSMEPLTLS